MTTNRPTSLPVVLLAGLLAVAPGAAAQGRRGSRPQAQPSGFWYLTSTERVEIEIEPLAARLNAASVEEGRAVVQGIFEGVQETAAHEMIPSARTRYAYAVADALDRVAALLTAGSRSYMPLTEAPDLSAIASDNADVTRHNGVIQQKVDFVRMAAERIRYLPGVSSCHINTCYAR